MNRLVAAAAAAAIASACSAASERAPGTPSDPLEAPPPAALPVDASTMEAAAENDAAPPLSLGSVPMTDVPDAPCIVAGGSALGWAPAGADAPVFDRVGVIGGRLYASSADGPFLRTAECDGSSPSPLVDGVVAAAPKPGYLAAVRADASSLTLVRFDPSGAEVGTPFALSDGASVGASLVAGEASVLALYCRAATIEGWIVADDGLSAASLGWTGAGNLGGTCHTGAAWNGTDYGVAWSFRADDATYRTAWSRAGAGTPAPNARVVLATEAPHSLVDFARVPGGYALLVDLGIPTQAFAIVRIDDDGVVAPPALRFAGSGEGFGLAANGPDLGVVGRLRDGRAAMRALDAAGAPLAPWVCLDDSAPSTGFYARAAITAVGPGWGLLARNVDGSTSYRVTDHRGGTPP